MCRGLHAGAGVLPGLGRASEDLCRLHSGAAALGLGRGRLSGPWWGQNIPEPDGGWAGSSGNGLNGIELCTSTGNGGGIMFVYVNMIKHPKSPAHIPVFTGGPASDGGLPAQHGPAAL